VAPVAPRPLDIEENRFAFGPSLFKTLLTPIEPLDLSQV
jgi:hypothetical protein